MILRKGLLTIVIQLFQLVAIVAITVLVTRVTGAHGRGVYTLVYALANLASMITALGISWAGIYYIGKRLFPLADVASTLLTVSLAAAGVAVAGLAAAFFLFRSSYFHDVSLTQAVIMLVLAAIIQVMTTSSSIVLGMNRPLAFSGLSLLQFGVALVLQGILALAGLLTASSALIALAIGAASSGVLGLVIVRREVPLRLALDSKILRSFLNFGIRGYLANLMQFMNYRLDALIVNGLLGLVSVGFYSIATAMAEALWYGSSCSLTFHRLNGRRLTASHP